MKKKIIILIISIILLSSICILVMNFTKTNNNEKQTSKEEPVININWTIIDGKEIDNSNIRKITSSFDSKIQFNSVSSNRDLFTAIALNNINLLYISRDKISYEQSAINIDCFNGAVKNKDDLLNEIYNDIKSNSSTYVIKKAEDKELIYLYANYYNKKNIYQEVLYIIKVYDSLYSAIKYTAHEQTFTENILNKIISGFKVEKDKADYTGCIEKDTEYNCTIELQNNHKLNYNIKTDDFVVSELDPVIKNNYIYLIQFNLDTLYEVNASIDVLYGIDISSYKVNTLDYDKNSYKQGKQTIGNREFDVITYSKKENEDDTSYHGEYFYKIDEYQTLRISIISYENNLDEVIKTLMDFKVE